jgi:hypothetical protein
MGLLMQQVFGPTLLDLWKKKITLLETLKKKFKILG